MLTLTSVSHNVPSPNVQPTNDQRLKDACVEFETVFVSQLMREMRASIPEDGIIKRSNGEKLFQEMLDVEYARTMSRANTRGIAAQLYKQLQSAIQTPPPGPLPQTARTTRLGEGEHRGTGT